MGCRTWSDIPSVLGGWFHNTGSGHGEYGKVEGKSPL